MSGEVFCRACLSRCSPLYLRLCALTAYCSVIFTFVAAALTPYSSKLVAKEILTSVSKSEEAKRS